MKKKKEKKRKRRRTGECSEKIEIIIRTKEKFLAVGETCVAVF